MFSLFPGSWSETIDLEKYIRKVNAAEVLFHEGQPFNDLCIPLNISLTISTKNVHNVVSTIGIIQPGRSAILYNFLRGLPSQYSISSDSAGEVLMIPRQQLDEWFSEFPAVKDYLLKTSDGPVFRGVVRDLRSLELSQEFIVEFISRLEEMNLSAHNYLCHSEVTPSGAYFLAEGKFLSRSSRKANSSWLLPLNTWVGWVDAIQRTNSDHSILTLSKAACLYVKTDALTHLSTTFVEDFETLNTWIVEGAFKVPTEKDEDEEVVEDAIDLFKGSLKAPKFKFSFPWVQQSNEMDCGPACLTMISQYFGKNVSSHFWRSKLSTDRTGTSLFDLATTTERFGFISHCLEVTDLKEVDQFLLPFIALRKYHYSVVYKIKKDSVVIGDPGVGIREMSFAEFYDGFENMGLFLKPNTDFLNHNDAPSNWKHYLQLFRGLELDMVLALGCSLLGVVLALIPAVISQVALDEVLVQKDKDLLWLLLGTGLGVSVLSTFIKWAESYYYVFIMGKFNFRATSVFIQKMLSLPYQFFAQRHVGDFTHRLSEMAHLRSFVTGTLFGSILNLVSMVLYAGALFLISTRAAFLVVALAPFFLIIPFLTSKYLSRLYADIFAKSSAQSSYLTDLVKGISAIKSSGAELTARFRFENRLLSLIKSQTQFSMASVHVETLMGGYNQIANVLVLGLTVYLGLSGEMSVGKVISFSLVANRVFFPLLQLAGQWDHFIEMKSVLSRLNDIFLAPSDQTEQLNRTGKVHAGPFAGEIEFKDVWFRYGGEASDWVLKGISFKIEKGQKVSVVGPSGSGKSTLAYLLTRMYVPTKGQILIDGRDYREYDLEWLRKQVGLLHQENFLFEGTIAENIVLNSNEVDEDAFQRALVRAGATELIDKKGGPYSHVPNGGLGFSGGEKQKIILARLFYQDPSLIILDEATSALDGISEKEVLEHLKSEMKDQTVLNIAHRFSTVVASDYGLVLWDGKVAGFGSLEYLQANVPAFQKLFNLEEIQPAVRKVA